MIASGHSGAHPDPGDPPGFDPARLTAFLNSLGDAARHGARKHFRRRIAGERKPDNSPVTIADREIESNLRRLIRDAHPDHSILGEEHGDDRRGGEWTWIIDPVDGTKSFLTGKPTFGTLVALACGDTPVAGLIEVPALNERWIGVDGIPSTYNGRPCRTNASLRLDTAVVYATTIDMFNEAERACFDAVTRKSWFRVFGADCYAYGLLASGSVDIVMEAAMSSHDYLALVPVIGNAGGVISDWQGKALGLSSGSQVLACASVTLHEQVLEIINAAGA